MKVLLIQPPNAFMKQAYGVNQKVSFGHAPPLNLAIIASYLEMDLHEVAILDAVALGYSLEQTADFVRQHNPDVVGLTVLTNYADISKELAEMIKKAMPHVTIVLGGAHATYYYEEILHEMTGIDHVIYGEADTNIRDYVKYVNDPEKLQMIEGLVYRGTDGAIVVNPPARVLHNLDEVPFPAWHLLDMSLYRPLPRQYKRMPWFTMITSRGCWWQKCTFCFQAGRKVVQYRTQSPERVIRELDVLYQKYGIREVNFWDDAFVTNEKWLLKFGKLLKEKGLDICWAGSGRVDTLNDSVLKAAHNSGCWSIFIGVESGDQGLLNLIDKGISIDKTKTVFKMTKEIGIETRGAFMLGLPGETPELGRKTINFALELDPTYAIFYATHPRKGTLLYDIALSSGKFLSHNFRGMSKVTYVPDGYESPEQLERMIKKAYLRFYLRPSFILRSLKKLNSTSAIRELILSFLLFIGLTNNKAHYG